MKKRNLFGSHATIMALLGVFSALAYGGQASQVTPAPQSAAVPERPSSLEGNWFVEWENGGFKGAFGGDPKDGSRVQGYITLTRGKDDGDWRTVGTVTWVDKGAQRKFARYGGYPRLAPEGALTVSFNLGAARLAESVLRVGRPDAPTIIGEWSYQERPNFRDATVNLKGKEIWRRAKPSIARVGFKYDTGETDSRGYLILRDRQTPAGTPGLVELTYGGPNWSPETKSLGDRPSFPLEVFGENLWGTHQPWIEPTTGLVATLQGEIHRGDNPLDPASVIGMKMLVYVLPAAKPGRKTLYLDGIPIPFELVIKGYPGKVGAETPEKVGDEALGKAPKLADAKTAYGVADNALP